jgi:hypothetical protein
MSDRTTTWWIKCVIHNCVIHPMLPLADALNALGLRALPHAVYWLHDRSAPVGGG